MQSAQSRRANLSNRSEGSDWKNGRNLVACADPIAITADDVSDHLLERRTNGSSTMPFNRHYLKDCSQTIKTNLVRGLHSGQKLGLPARLSPMHCFSR